MKFDINLPNVPEDGMMTQAQGREIVEYLYSLEKYLRYMFSHIDGENLTDELNGRIDSSGTDEELVRRIEDSEGRVAEIILTAKGLATRVTNAEGDISEVQQTAQAIITRVTDAEGDISEVQQTAQGILSRVSDAEGNISQVAQTALSLVARVTDAEGGISEIKLTTDGIQAAVKNNRLRFSERGLEIINAAGDVVFRQDNVTGDLTITGIIRALGGIIGGFTITEDSLRTTTAEISSSGNGFARFGKLLITDSVSSGPVLEALAGLSFIIGGALHMVLGNNGVTMNRTLYAQSGFYINPSKTTDKPANLYVDPTTGEVMRTTNTSTGGGTDPGGGEDPGPGPTLDNYLTTVPASPRVQSEIYFNMGASGGVQPYIRYMLRILQPDGTWWTAYDGPNQSWGPSVFFDAGYYTATATVWDSAGWSSTKPLTFYVSP